jgi:hypothetical protein
MSSDFFEHIGEQLRNHEASLAQHLTFEEVMKRREKKKRRMLFWWQTAVMSSLILGSLGVYLIKNPDLSSNKNADIRSNAFTDFATTEKIINQSEHARNSISNDISTLETDPLEPVSSQDPQSVKGVKELPQKQKNATGILGVFQSFNKQRKQLLTPNKLKAPVQTTSTSNNKNSPINAKQGGTLQWRSTDLGVDPVNFPIEKETSPMALANVYDFGAKNYLRKIPIKTQISWNNDAYIDWDFQHITRSDRYLKLPWYVELSAITGSNNQIQFDSKEPISVLGTNYMAQYQLSLLKEFKGGDLWGMGLQYTQWVGNGEWRKQEWVEVLELDSKTIAINIPGLPTQYYTQYDTVNSVQNQVTTGAVNYQIDKWALPLSHRGFFQLFKTPFRYALQLSPGITRASKGTYFTPTEITQLEQIHRFSLGGKIALGPIVPVGNGLSIALEPALMYQSFMHQNKGLKGNVFGGFGISMMWRLK